MSKPNSEHQRESEVSFSSFSYEEPIKVSCTKRFIDTFKRVDLDDQGFDTSMLTEMEKAAVASANHPLARRLKNRHIQMLAIGGSIGTGLFIGNGYALSFGPGSLLIGYTFVGVGMILMMNGLAEIACSFPVSGAFISYFSRFLEPSLGFTISLLYILSWLISFPSELIACSITISYWNSSVNPAVWVAIFYVLIVCINLFGVIGFGEVEFWLCFIKVLAVIGFIILGICIICGAGDKGYIGGRYWTNPGSFNYGFKGICNTFISAAFSFGGLELACLAAAETKNVRKAIPKSVKQVVWRVFIFYFLTSIIVGCLVPYDDERLLSGSSSEDISASPFVIAINNGGIKVLPDIMNAIILVAVLSVGNSSVYAASRSIAASAVQGYLPRYFGYIDRHGRPLIGILVTSLFGLLGFLVSSENQDVVFTWLFAVCSLSAFFTWFCTCFAHVRFRWALYEQGRSTDELTYVSPTGLYGSYLGMLIFFLIIAAEIYISASPAGYPSSAEGFFQYCLSLPILIVLYVCHKTYKRTWSRMLIRLQEIDLDTGRREEDLEALKQEIAEERAELAKRPWIYRVYHFWC